MIEPPKKYCINTDSLGAAIVALVEAFKLDCPSVGTFKATCHDGSRVTIALKGEKNAKETKELRELPPRP